MGGSQTSAGFVFCLGGGPPGFVSAGFLAAVRFPSGSGARVVPGAWESVPRRAPGFEVRPAAPPFPPVWEPALRSLSLRSPEIVVGDWLGPVFPVKIKAQVDQSSDLRSSAGFLAVGNERQDSAAGLAASVGDEPQSVFWPMAGFLFFLSHEGRMVTRDPSRAVRRWVRESARAAWGLRPVHGLLGRIGAGVCPSCYEYRLMESVVLPDTLGPLAAPLFSGGSCKLSGVAYRSHRNSGRGGVRETAPRRPVGGCRGAWPPRRFRRPPPSVPHVPRRSGHPQALPVGLSWRPWRVPPSVSAAVALCRRVTACRLGSPPGSAVGGLRLVFVNGVHPLGGDAIPPGAVRLGAGAMPGKKRGVGRGC